MAYSSPSEVISVDCKPYINGSAVSKTWHATEKTEKLEELIGHLEEEKLKIEVFKRELPLCMQLLTNAVEASRKELQSHRVNQVSVEKAKWMASATLWNHQVEETSSESQSQSQKVNADLALGSSSYYEREIEEISEVSRREKSVGNGNGNKEKRKARRCWSPHLHRRFLNALHMLGGSQLATPKQITQLMKVDGLTSDEVKSHLQKYRLHTGIQQQGPRPVVMVGSIWVPPPPEYAAHGHGGAPPAAFYGIPPPRLPPP